MTPPVGVVADSITFFGVVQNLKEVLPHHLLVDVQPQEEGVGEQEHHPHPERGSLTFTANKISLPEVKEEGVPDLVPLLQDEDDHDRMPEQGCQGVVAPPHRHLVPGR